MGSSSRNRHPLTRPHPHSLMIKKKTAYLRKTSPVGVEVNNKDWLLQMIPKWRKNGMATHPKAHYTIITMKIDTSICGENGHHKLRGTKAMTLPEGPCLNKGASQPEGGIRIWGPEAWKNPSPTLDTHKTPRTHWFANSISR